MKTKKELEDKYYHLCKQYKGLDKKYKKLKQRLKEDIDKAINVLDEDSDD